LGTVGVNPSFASFAAYSADGGNLDNYTTMISLIHTYVHIWTQNIKREGPFILDFRF